MKTSVFKKNMWIYIVSILIIIGITIWMLRSKESFGSDAMIKKKIQVQPSKLTTSSDFCINLPNGNTASGTKLQLQECNHTNAQNFGYDWNTKIIKHNPSGKCIQTGNRGGSLSLQNCENKNTQKWELKTVGNMGQSWKSMANNLCIDIKNNNIKNGTPIQAYDCNGTDAQLMYFKYYSPGEKSPASINAERRAQEALEKLKKAQEDASNYFGQILSQAAQTTKRAEDIESSKKQADFLNDWIDDGCQAAGIRRYARQVDAKNMDWEKAADLVIEYQVPKIGEFFKTGNVLYIAKEKKLIGGMWVAVYVNDQNCGDVNSVLETSLQDLEKVPLYGAVYAPIIRAWTGIIPIEDVVNAIKKDLINKIKNK